MTAIDMQHMLEELRQSYIQEMPSRIQEMETLVMALGRQESVNDNFEDLYRKVHSMKGSGGSYGFNIITSICHQFEDFLEDLDFSVALSSGFVDTGLAYVDLLKSAFTAIDNGESQFHEIEQSMGVLSSKVFSGAAAIMLVTDQASLSALCSSLAEGAGGHVTVVRSGIAALQRMQHESFDLLVTGLENIELNGLALIAANRLSDGVSRNARTILVTSKIGRIKDFGHANRLLDPDEVIVRDTSFAGNFVGAVERQLRHARRAD